MSKLTKEERLAGMIEASNRPFVPSSERTGRASRDIACRRCAKRTDRHDDGRWYHEDGTVACVDPESLKPYEGAN